MSRVMIKPRTTATAKGCTYVVCGGTDTSCRHSSGHPPRVCDSPEAEHQQQCFRCGGEGMVHRRIQERRPCPDCRGTGRSKDHEFQGAKKAARPVTA